MTLSRLLATSLVVLVACGDDEPSMSAATIDAGLLGESNVDAAGPLDAFVPPGPDAAAPSSSSIYDAPPRFVAPASPGSFLLSYKRSDCYGHCQSYRVSIDQSGRVAYVGGVCTERPGSFTQQLSAEAARALYDAFVSTKFWHFGPRYSRLEDGCTRVYSDSQGFDFAAVVDGHEQSTYHYSGCDGIAELADLDQLGKLIPQHTQIGHWLGGPLGAGDCVAFAPDVVLEPSYRLMHEGSTLGLLSLDARQRTWQLTECGGAVIAGGTLLRTPARATLLDASDGTIKLPQGLGDAASIVIDKYPTSEPVVRALRERAEDDLTLSLVSATDC